MLNEAYQRLAQRCSLMVNAVALSPLYSRVKLSVGFCFFYYRSLTPARKVIYCDLCLTQLRYALV